MILTLRLLTLPGLPKYCNIGKKDKKTLINLKISILAGTFLRYKVDNKKEIEKFYQPDEDIAISAENTLLVWLSNAGAVKFNFFDFGQSITPNELGKIDVKIIYWNSTDNINILQMGSLK